MGRVGCEREPISTWRVVRFLKRHHFTSRRQNCQSPASEEYFSTLFHFTFTFFCFSEETVFITASIFSSGTKRDYVNQPNIFSHFLMSLDLSSIESQLKASQGNSEQAKEQEKKRQQQELQLSTILHNLLTPEALERRLSSPLDICSIILFSHSHIISQLYRTG